MLHAVDTHPVCRSFDVTMMHRHKFYLSCFTTDPVLTDPLNSEMELYRRSVQLGMAAPCGAASSGQAARHARDAASDMHNLKRATHDMSHEQHAT